MAVLAERRLLALLGADIGDGCVVWCSGVTEALNLAARGVSSVRGPVLVDSGAHQSLLLPCTALGGHRIPLDGGGRLRLPLSVGSGCGLLALSHVNNETGAVQDLLECRAFLGQGLMLVDGAQSFGKMEIPWLAARIDMLALSSRKIGGPAAVGALVIRRGVKVSPLILGGGQQGGLRSGTLDVCGIEMFVRAAEAACGAMRRNALVVSELAGCLRERVESAGLPPHVWISPPDASPYIQMLAFPGYEGAVIARCLAEHEGIVIASSAACTAEHGGTSPALEAMGVPEDVAKGAIRISFDAHNTCAEVSRLVEALARVFAAY